MSSKSKRSQVDHDHGPPITRRDFISRGIIEGGAFLMAPTLLGALLKSTLAEAALSCPTAAGNQGLIPFLSIDCAGGAGLSGNLVVGTQTSGALSLLSTYDVMGIPYSPGSTPGSIDSRFGTSFHVGPSPGDSTRPISFLFDGIIKSTSASTQANTRIVSICHKSLDDSRNNEINPSLAVAKAGLTGRYFKNGIGTVNSLSGANSAPSIIDGTYRPMYANSVTSVLNALSYGSVVGTYSTAKKTSMAKALSSLSQSQAQKFAALPQNDQFQNLVNCGLISNEGLASVAPNVDPRTNSVMQSIYGLTTTTSNSDALRAAVVYNVLMGNSGPGSITVGGCDYHNSALPGATNHGDLVDFQIGQQIGRALEAASQLGKPIFIGVYSDGSVSSTAGTRVWTGDAGSRSLAFMVYFKPSGISNNRNNQIGNFTTGGTASSTPFFGGNPKYVSYIMLANYLSICGQLGSFAGQAPIGFPTDSTTLNSVIGFG